MKTSVIIPVKTFQKSKTRLQLSEEKTKDLCKLLLEEVIKTVYETTGQYDITTIMSGSSIAEINNSIDALRKISGVVDTNTVIILRKVA